MFSNSFKCLLVFYCVYCGCVSAKPITVVTEYLPKFQVKNEDGTLGGYATTVVNRLFELTNLPSNVSVLPWARAFSMAKSEPNIMIFSIMRTRERERDFHWVANLQTQRFFLWGLKKQFSQPLSSFELAKQYRVSTTKGYSAHYLFEKHGFKNILLTVRDSQNIGMLFKGRVDIIASPQERLKGRLSELNYSMSKLQRLVEVPALNKELSIAFSKGTSPHLIKRFQTAFIYLKKTGELARIQKKWGIISN